MVIKIRAERAVALIVFRARNEIKDCGIAGEDGLHDRLGRNIFGFTTATSSVFAAANPAVRKVAEVRVVRFAIERNAESFIVRRVGR